MNEFRYTQQVVIVPLLFLILMWGGYLLQIKFDWNLTTFGILPRTLTGLRGIIFSPFLHGGFKHLFNNSIPIAVLTASLFYFYREVAYKVLFWGALFTGILTWLIGRESYHIGASGVIYMLFSFIFFSGIIRKYYRLTALSFGVIFLYGSMIWYLFPIEDKISWEGHLSGFLVGLTQALIYKQQGPQKKAFVYRKTEFDTWFDEDGNFNPPEPEELDKDETDKSITYTFKPSPKEE